MGMPSYGWFRRFRHQEVPEAPAPPRPPRTQAQSRARSRSPPRPALDPLRRDAPGRRGGRLIGSLPQWTGEEDQALALEEFYRDVLAASTQEALAAKLRTIHRALAGWGLVPFPPTLLTIRALGATLKRGGYRSAASYLYLLKTEAQRRGHDWPDHLQRALKDAIRSCERGLGPPTRAQPLPLHLLGRLPPGCSPWNAGGPTSPRAAVVVGAWWLMREVELATLRATHAEFTGCWTTSGLGVRLTLPASKNDQAALGASRAHSCKCVRVVRPDCPAHAVAFQFMWLQRAFPARFTDGRPDLDLPLFPDALGRAAEKSAMTATIVHAARALGVVDLADGSERVSGHSLRSTGAQGLIRLGWRHDAVQLMGRWESEAVKRYTRLAALESPVTLPAALSDLCGIPLSDVPPTDSAPSPSAEPEPAIPTPETWILNSETGMYHLPGRESDRARCGWRHLRAGIRGEVPPPWHLVTCKSCAPRLYRQLKEQARATARAVRGHPDSDL